MKYEDYTAKFNIRVIGYKYGMIGIDIVGMNRVRRRKIHCRTLSATGYLHLVGLPSTSTRENTLHDLGLHER